MGEKWAVVCRDVVDACCHLREGFCYITVDFGTELTSTGESSDNDKTYALPDGNINTVRTVRGNISSNSKNTARLRQEGESAAFNRGVVDERGQN